MWGSKGGGWGQRMICQGGQTKAYFTVIYKVLHSFSRGLDTPPPLWSMHGVNVCHVKAYTQILMIKFDTVVKEMIIMLYL